MMGAPMNMNMAQNNMMNYKIVKCKNFEKDGTCKYGENCTFAHGNNEIRSKSDKIAQMNNRIMMPMMYGMNSIPLMMPAQGMDMSQLQQMMAAGNNNPNQFMMMNIMPPNQEGLFNNENINQPNMNGTNGD